MWLPNSQSLESECIFNLQTVLHPFFKNCLNCRFFLLLLQVDLSGLFSACLKKRPPPRTRAAVTFSGHRGGRMRGRGPLKGMVKSGR